MKRITYLILFSLFSFLAGGNLLLAQVDTVLYEEFDNGQGQWVNGWIDAANATVTFSIDNTSKLSGANSYKAVITSAKAEMYRIQRIHDLPLVAGYQYTVSFLAVADSNALINCLFELAGDPYTKRIDDTASVTSTPQTFTYTMSATESVPTNQVKFMFGGAQNSGRTIWIDSIIVTRVPDPSLVTQWGRTKDGFGAAWPILNDSSTAGGDGSIAGSQPMPAGSNGASLRGGFDTLTATLDKAVVISGQLEYVGGGMGSVYTPLRYALTFQDSATLQDQYTDTAYWVSPKKHFGYEFTPRTGIGVQPNGAGGGGSVWTVNNGNWASTYSNGGKPIGPIVNQAPRNAEITAGTYNWAISVKQVSDTTNEIRWYIEKTDNSYWFGGTVIDTAVSTKFNAISFWLKDGEATQFNVKGVRASLGDPITVPVAPWQAYYLDQWGRTKDGFGAAWPILNDSDYVVGDASIAGPQPMPSGTNGASLRGGFGQDITIPTDKAVIVKGQLEYVGGGMGSVYTPLRYAITYQDSVTLQNPLTDTAYWVSTKKHYGYELTPRSGTGVQPNGAGGGGSVWTINNGNWASTYSNGGAPFGIVDQAPRNAEIAAGKYNWAISVQQINDTTNELRWYIVKTDNKYWFGGIVQVPAVTHKLNGVEFWLKDGEATQFNILACQIDINTPIDIPVQPWEAYFVDKWGFFGGKMGGWTISNTDVVGNVTISGSAANTDWSAVRGEFSSFTPTSSKPLKITGKVEFVGGGFDVSSSLRIGVFNTDSAKTYILDTATATLPDSTRWTGTDNYCSGYLFIPQSGTNGTVAWGDGNQGTWGAVKNYTWLDPTGSHNYILGSQLPDPSTGGAGTYNFSISVTPESNGQLVKFNLIKQGGNYGLGGQAVDNNSLSKFNSIAFALNAGNSITAMNITDVEIDTGTVTAVNDLTNKAVPVQYSLSQNYPNPFNPTTTIKFALPKASDVSLIVYDILGRKVAELVKGNLNAGYHTVNFNAANLASGVYFYQIKAGDFVNVKKLMLLK